MIVEQHCVIIESLKKLSGNSTPSNISIGKKSELHIQIYVQGVPQEIICKAEKFRKHSNADYLINTWYSIYTKEPFEIHIPFTHEPLEIIFSKNTWRNTIFHNRSNGEKTVYKIMP